MKPYKCPVCNGNGQVPGGFYLGTGEELTSDTSFEECRSCVGKGIVWESDCLKYELGREILEPKKEKKEFKLTTTENENGTFKIQSNVPDGVSQEAVDYLMKTTPVVEIKDPIDFIEKLTIKFNKMKEHGIPPERTFYLGGRKWRVGSKCFYKNDVRATISEQKEFKKLYEEFYKKGVDNE